jgi:ABC-type sugar transport system permease subunit
MKKSNRNLTLFILPALLFYAIFTLAPAFGGIWYSFTNWNGLNPNYELDRTSKFRNVAQG